MSSLARVGALVAAGTLVTTGLVSGLTSPAVAASNDPRPATIGAAWLEGQLVNGLLPGDYGPLYGQSIDAALSLLTVKGQDTAVDSIRSAMAAAVQNNAYITGEAYSDTGSTYAGAVAKTLVLAEQTGGGETSFGGVDLVTRLEGQVSSTSPNAGRIQDTSTYGDYANTLGQAFAARGLSAASSTKAPDVISFLLQQQCSDGYFRQDFSAPTDSDQTCDGGIAGGTSQPSVDATAIAVQQLQAISSPPPTVANAVSTAIGNGVSWLKAHQRADGSFAADAQLGTNTDSTGVAGAVLADAGESAAAERAAVWVRAHQADEAPGCATALTDQPGAIAYDDAALADGRSSGLGSGQQWRIAAAQALPVLKVAPAATSAFGVTGPTGFVKARSTVTFHVSGAAPGSTLCLSGAGAAHRATADAAGTAAIAATMPRGTAVRVLTAAGSTASDTASVRVLGARTFKVRPSRWTVHRGGRVHVVVRGLVRGERVVLRVRGVKVRVGTANARGRFVADVRVGHRLGKARIVARGQFPAIRHGRAVVHVVR